MTRINWTREMLRVEAATGTVTVEHVQLAIEFGVKVNTIYSMRAKLRQYESIDAFLGNCVRASNRHRGTGRSQDVYLITHSRKAGRGQSTQYHLTVPPTLAEAFIARFGRRVRFEAQPDGSILIVTAGSGRTEPGSAGTEPPATEGSA